MANHGQTSHCDKDCINIKNQPWSAVFILGLIIFILRSHITGSSVVNHGSLLLTMVDHGQPWSNVVGFIIFILGSHITGSSVVEHASLLLTMVSHGRMLYCDKDCFNMKISNGEPLSNLMLQKKLSRSLGFINPRVQIPRV